MYNEEIEMFLEEYKENMSKAVAHLVDELFQIRAGRANPKIIERITVDYYGTMTPISQMSTISVPEARMIMISVWDISQLKAVSKAIEAANLGLNPSDDGRVIRLIFPALTEERRKDIVKQVKKMCEDSKVALRNIRRDCLDSLKKMNKAKEMTDDEYAGYEADVEKSVAKAIELVEKVTADKEKEILTV